LDFPFGWGNIAAPLFSHSTTQGKRAAFNGCLPKPVTDVSVLDFNKFCFPAKAGTGRWQDAIAPV